MTIDKIAVPTYSAELKTRISQAIERIGSLKDAARCAGTSEDSLINWREGRSRPSFFGMAGLARAAGLSLEWLASGDGPMYRAEIIGLPRAASGSSDDPAGNADESQGRPAKGDWSHMSEELDIDLLCRALDDLAQIHQAAGISRSAGELGRIAVGLVRDIVALAPPGPARDGALAMSLLHIQRDLDKTVNNAERD